MDIMMSPSSRSALRSLEGMADQLNQLLAGKTMSRRDGDESMAVADWAPSVNVLETDSEFLIEAELPGIDKKDLRISVEKGLLTISGHRMHEREEKGKRYHRVERAYGNFLRSFRLPDTVDDQKLAAELKNGILTIHLPKSEKAMPKSIEVTVT